LVSVIVAMVVGVLVVPVVVEILVCVVWTGRVGQLCIWTFAVYVAVHRPFALVAVVAVSVTVTMAIAAAAAMVAVAVVVAVSAAVPAAIPAAVPAAVAVAVMVAPFGADRVAPRPAVTTLLCGRAVAARAGHRPAAVVAVVGPIVCDVTAGAQVEQACVGQALAHGLGP
jgi:hypothetical protein